MEDIPQPAPDAYAPGDRVKVYLGSDDPDARFHGVEAEVIDVFEDSLDEETGRMIDRYSYRVRRVDTGNELPVQFRHRDLVPASAE